MKRVTILAILVLLATTPLAAQEKSKKTPFIKDRPVLFLWAATATVNAMDVHSTEVNLAGGPGAREADPLLVPIFKQPAAASYAELQGYVFLLAYASHRMRQSRNPVLRRIWFIPLIAQASANIFGLVHNSHQPY